MSLSNVSKGWEKTIICPECERYARLKKTLFGKGRYYECDNGHKLDVNGNLMGTQPPSAKQCPECGAAMKFKERINDREYWDCDNGHIRVFRGYEEASRPEDIPKPFLNELIFRKYDRRSTQVKVPKPFLNELRKPKEEYDENVDWMYLGGGLKKQFPDKWSREQAVNRALKGAEEEPDGKMSIFQRLKYRYTDPLLKDAEYRRTVRDFCPECKRPTLLARYDVGNNTNTPNYYKCSYCGYRVTEVKPFLKKRRTTLLSWLPRLLVILTGIIAFSMEVSAFGGGEYQLSQIWFILGGGTIGVISWYLGYRAARKKENDRELRETKESVEKKTEEKEAKHSTPSSPSYESMAAEVREKLGEE